MKYLKYLLLILLVCSAEAHEVREKKEYFDCKRNPEEMTHEEWTYCLPEIADRAEESMEEKCLKN